MPEPSGLHIFRKCYPRLRRAKTAKGASRRRPVAGKGTGATTEYAAVAEPEVGLVIVRGPPGSMTTVSCPVTTLKQLPRMHTRVRISRISVTIGAMMKEFENPAPFKIAVKSPTVSASAVKVAVGVLAADCIGSPGWPVVSVRLVTPLPKGEKLGVAVAVKVMVSPSVYSLLSVRRDTVTAEAAVGSKSRVQARVARRWRRDIIWYSSLLTRTVALTLPNCDGTVARLRQACGVNLWVETSVFLGLRQSHRSSSAPARAVVLCGTVWRSGRRNGLMCACVVRAAT